jgi:uncharacterized protein (DUF1778 family)
MALRKDEFHYESDEHESANKSQSTEWHDLTIRVSAELDERIRKAAERQNVSIGQYLENLLNHAIPLANIQRSSRISARQEGLKKLMQIQDQILQEHGGVPFENTIELLRESREERDEELGF